MRNEYSYLFSSVAALSFPLLVVTTLLLVAKRDTFVYSQLNPEPLQVVYASLNAIILALVTPIFVTQPLYSNYLLHVRNTSGVVIGTPIDGQEGLSTLIVLIICAGGFAASLFLWIPYISLVLHAGLIGSVGGWYALALTRDMATIAQHGSLAFFVAFTASYVFFKKLEGANRWTTLLFTLLAGTITATMMSGTGHLTQDYAQNMLINLILVSVSLGLELITYLF